MEKFKCIVVDDDEVAGLKVVSVARSFPILNIVKVFTSAEKSVAFIEKEKIEVLFLDIDMPGINGLEFRKKVLQIPVCVYITSHPEYAVDSFELETLDFIIKPLQLERFAQAVKRIEEFMDIKQKASLYELSFGNDFIYIKEGYEQTKVKLQDVLYLEALKDYTLLITPQKRHCVLSSIGNLLKEVQFKQFIRVHRSFAVQKNYIQKIGTQNLTLTNATIIPIGHSYKNNVNFML
jgi:DNA-binding LytR/AlgR family response regulator